MEYKSASTHILLNCPEVQPYYDLFVEIHGQETVSDQFGTWFNNYMAGDKKGKAIAKAPKKSKKKGLYIPPEGIEPGPLRIGARDPAPCLPPLGPPMSGVADGLSWSQPTGHVAVPPYFLPQGQTEPHARRSQSPITPLTIPHGLSEFYHVSQRATRSGTPTATPSPTVSQPSTSSTLYVGTSGREESSSDSDEERPKKGDPHGFEF
ncbi:uncharacterized protein LOC132045442 [Lycium ferocissimum]|uniref:uncharacterized protein LOC132045442 n=1 Tax=Lycium ferocissimum TaxID=112874 RepID=UPI002815161B|nr:uncharacterized protein LOC132045442 [Lycium ferocissimum]